MLNKAGTRNQLRRRCMTKSHTEKTLKKLEDIDGVVPSVVPSNPEGPSRDFGRDADNPEARKKGATYPWTIPQTQNFMKVLKMLLLIDSVSY